MDAIPLFVFREFLTGLVQELNALEDEHSRVLMAEKASHIAARLLNAMDEVMPQ